MIEGHVLAAKLDVERAADQARIDTPLRGARRSMLEVAAQSIRNHALVEAFLVEAAATQRLMPQDWKGAGQRFMGQTAILMRDGVPEVLLEMRHAGFRRDHVGTRDKKLRCPSLEAGHY